MRILVISDTHIPTTADRLPKIIEKEARISDCCIHAGDFTSYATLVRLKKITKVYGVCGNMDDVAIQKALPKQQVIVLDKLTIGITHGYGKPNDTPKQIKKTFSFYNEKIDIFIFGHSHRSLDKEINGQLFFNPGSPTDTFYAPYTSYGVIELTNGKIKRKIIKNG